MITRVSAGASALEFLPPRLTMASLRPSVADLKIVADLIHG